MAGRKKKVLCVDLGDVLIKFEERYIKALIKPEKFEDFLLLIHDHDRGNLELFELHKLLIQKEYFLRPVSWGELIQAYANCIYDVHTPMFLALDKLKNEKRAKLVCITDINHFCFYITSLKFPGVCGLFHEDGQEQWILSYILHSLKRDLGPFIRVSNEFGFSLKEACFVDNVQLNIDKAIEAGFNKNSCFLYDRLDPENHIRFLEFTDKHFPV